MLQSIQYVGSGPPTYVYSQKAVGASGEYYHVFAAETRGYNGKRERQEGRSDSFAKKLEKESAELEAKKIKYDEIYDGGVWNNVFVLLEMTDDSSKKDFQNFIIELYEKWVVLLKDRFQAPGANEYILKTMCAFFQLGVTLRLDILGY